ncbi:MAG: hypothetical protein M1818_004748 [Claussenomyces sp. TS43310]|nr:MAG: hypothetical protein M1818_004748 [Claussenomyces sp. TS43310]
MARSSDEDTVGRNNDAGMNSSTSEPKGGEQQENNDGGESGNGQDSHQPIGFFHSNLKAARFDVIKNWALTTLILMVFIMMVLSLYWAVLFRVQQNLSALVVWVVDFDAQVAPYTGMTAIVGPQIVQAAEKLISPVGAVGWGSLPASQFNHDPMEVRRQIYDYKAWAAVIVNANATALLREAVINGNASYDPMGAAQVVYVEARDETSHANYVMPQLTKFEQQVTSMFGEMWAKQVLDMADTNPAILGSLRSAPQAISPAIGFSTFNLRPFSPAIATPAVTIGLIYLIIIAFFSFTFYLPHHLKFVQSPGHRPLHFHQLIIWRLLSTITAYFFLSFAYSLISLAFQMPFAAPQGSHTDLAQPATAYHHASFFVYWMLNFVGMIALGLACENVAMFIGQPWTALWLIFWVITNVSTSFYSIDLAPQFYYWGYAWPLHNIVEGSRTILFNVHSRIGLNFGILAVWCVINTTLFPIACFFQRHMMTKSKKQEAEKKGD